MSCNVKVLKFCTCIFELPTREGAQLLLEPWPAGLFKPWHLVGIIKRELSTLSCPNTTLQVPLLYNLSERQFWQLACAMESVKFSKGQVVFHKGDPGDAFYIIQEGTFTCFDGESRW